MGPSELAAVVGAFSLLASTACVPAAVPSATATPSASPSPVPSPPPPFQADPCLAANMADTVKPLDDLVRQFDDYAGLAGVVLQSELVKVIPVLQSIRGAAQGLAAPSCIQSLRRYALEYMDSTLKALAAFQSGSQVAAIPTGIAEARQYHDQYLLERSRLLGQTVIAPTPLTQVEHSPAVTP